MRINRIIFSFIALYLSTTISLACTDIIVGKKASKDGSVITSHTGAAPECRVHYVPASDYSSGTMAPVYWGLQDVNKPYLDYGDIIGEIPQVSHTYAYFHSGYSHMNEFQLAIGESTISQKKELICSLGEGEQIMTIEQAMVFALQRCKTAKQAVKLIGQLVSTYGFLPSCGDGGEALSIADPNEAWIFEVFSVGPGWEYDAGKPGAIWAARRLEDDHITMIPNWSIIKKIDPTDHQNYLHSENYMQAAIDRGWYDPDTGKEFIWQDIYAPIPREWATGRFWLFFSTFAPNLKEWPDRYIKDPYDSYDNYHQYVEPLSIYPFSLKPEKKLSVKDVISFQRSVFEGTIYDKTSDVDWLVPDGKGGYVKSPLATPFPTKSMRELLDINNRRNVSKGGYGMVAQLRSWLPNEIGGVYWFYVDNQYTSTYVPIYSGGTKISELYKNYDPDEYSDESARWAVDFVDNLMYLKWQDAVKDLKKARDPLENSFFVNQEKIEKKALELLKEDREKAVNYLNDYTIECMEKTVNMYHTLRNVLISKYTNNKQGS